MPVDAILFTCYASCMLVILIIMQNMCMHVHIIHVQGKANKAEYDHTMYVYMYVS